MDAPLRKPKPPYYAGKQVTVTFNEKPKTEETFKQSPPPNNFHAKENEEDIDKSEEEKIRMATQSIKNVLKLRPTRYQDIQQSGHTYIKTLDIQQPRYVHLLIPFR